MVLPPIGYGNYKAELPWRRVRRNGLQIFPLPPLQPRTEYYGHNMTLCIAAVARSSGGGHSYITVSDHMLSSSSMSAEPVLVKTSFIGTKIRWAVMFAGDPTHAYSIIQRAINSAAGQTETFAVMEAAFKTAFKAELEQKINDELLSPMGITREQFQQTGKEAFGREIFGKMLYQIGNAKLETDLLIGNASRIFSVSDPGKIEYHDPLGFHAIGSGATLAEASLMGVIDSVHPVNHIIYRLLEAKFRGEAASGVGRKTFLTVMDATGACKQMISDECDHIRAIWEVKGKPPVPDSAKKLIDDLLKPFRGVPVAN